MSCSGTFRRLLNLIPFLFILTCFVFIIFQFLPGGPIDMLVPPDEVFDEGVRKAMEKELGVDRPIMVQYVDWLWHALQGDFGGSIFTHLPVWGLIVERVTATLYLAIAAIVLAIIVAISLGAIAALRKNTMTDYIAMGTSIFGLTAPNFWLALILILFFSLGLRWFPSMGYLDPTQDFFGSLKHFVMPAVVLAVSPCAIATRMTRSSMLDELNKQYVYTARSQGLPEWKIIVRNHGARIARRLLSNTALIVSRLTFYAAFDATTGRKSAPRIGPCNLLSHQVNVKGIEV